MAALTKKNIIVVSDTHLGHSKSNFEQFDTFLEYLVEAGKAKTPLIVQGITGEEKEIAYPEMIVFLGDIFELWEPKDDQIKHVGEQSRSLLEKIIELPCEKVYVLGNHDKSLENFAAQTYALKNGDLKIFYRHFPETAESEYVTIGERNYYFIHGHQFDKDMRKFKRLGEAGPSLLLSLQRINKQLFRMRGFGSFVLAALLYTLHFSELIEQSIILHVATFLFPFWIAGIGWPLGKPVARKLCKARDRDIKSIFKNGWYEPEKDTIAADNLVFAHTHYPGIADQRTLEACTGKKVKKELVINTGSWFQEGIVSNTFLHIDGKEVILFKWRMKESEKEKKAEKSEEKIREKIEKPEAIMVYDFEKGEVIHSEKYTGMRKK